ncbi:DivIVA domain-containing protein [Natronoglycomyces albus]|uniref:DivIVA domain-containing protein n=1 Tax=Natronoglycomyces albus TaxID=2811108 RepID=A0A895XXZ8_9ACTN|nr:DivIVA domain-containing protein [Natronoglycomyces albus]QSB07070.1 DivIVA domain-containing protein [Natronoglycomyces albus]
MSNPYFSVKFRGYDRDQVDTAIRRIRRAINEGVPPHPEALRDMGFQMSLRGYDTAEVDEYFDQVARTLSE